jgi:hypothetical protein
MVALYIYLVMAVLVAGRVLFGYLARWETPSKADAKLVAFWPYYMGMAAMDVVLKAFDAYSEAAGKD